VPTVVTGSDARDEQCPHTSADAVGSDAGKVIGVVFAGVVVGVVVGIPPPVVGGVPIPEGG
jgi:hypothetical protein